MCNEVCRIPTQGSGCLLSHVTGSSIFSMSLIMTGLLATATAAPPQSTIAIGMDAAGATIPFPHNWERAFGSGHALLATRSDWQAQLKRAVAEIGLRGVRMHGLLDDDMSVMPDAHTYSWYNVDRVFDFLVAEGVMPIVEVSRDHA